ncbi:Uncharacterised protein [Vibrio cholerae]|uniref:Uncharacterized protein n=1 Tax=Vibrio cholerae TaxID=666 RepID=A0A655YJ73_VIBCL|nr:Uncharacterised protein [Vibrio cholerae]CSB27606.1 Uncharacterised protein [Vibrio cholerae]CSC22590.1 Uncharacterised protein [Vibrio cholerae]CSC43175.1 Uncharacterised protein [Vibrio cholerae]CSC57487.1 Uncharacterised protein [Vibrio cholerae]
MTWQTPSDWVNTKSYRNTLSSKFFSNFIHGILRLRDRHTVSRCDDD